MMSEGLTTREMPSEPACVVRSYENVLNGVSVRPDVSWPYEYPSVRVRFLSSRSWMSWPLPLIDK